MNGSILHLEVFVFDEGIQTFQVENQPVVPLTLGYCEYAADKTYLVLC